VRTSRAWNDTLLIVLYDEHGGLFDHEFPPAAPPPDGNTALFSFDRYGLRVPAVLISPYIGAGTIVDTLFDHTSIPAMVKKTFGLPHFLTKRDAAASTFERAFARSAPRTDAPADMSSRVPAPAAPRDEWGDEHAGPAEMQAELHGGRTSSVPVSSLQMSLVQAARAAPILANDRVTELDHARVVSTEHDAAILLRQASVRIRQKRLARSR
jgi:phospholipase C